MTEADDRLLQAVANLRPITPDEGWEQRVRARCHSEMARRASRRRRAERYRLLTVRILETAAVAALCAYLSAVLREAGRLGGLL